MVNCLAEKCPNTVHSSCLGTRATFDCCQVYDLRKVQSICAPVVFQEAVFNSQQCEDTTSQAQTTKVLIPDDEEEELLKFEPNALVTIIRELRQELRGKKNILGFFDATSQRIAQQRDAAVTILDFIDNIAATKSSLDELDNRPIATTARP